MRVFLIGGAAIYYIINNIDIMLIFTVFKFMFLFVRAEMAVSGMIGK